MMEKYSCIRKLLITLLIGSFALAASAAARPASAIQDSSLLPGSAFHRMMLSIDSATANRPVFPLNEGLAGRMIRYGIRAEGTRLSILAVGDIMPGTNYPMASYLPADCEALFSPVTDLIRSADIATGNLEGVFSSAGGIPKVCKDTSNCYVFRMPDKYIGFIRSAGFDVLGTANNHVNDFGQTGRESTASLLTSAGMHFAGLTDFPFTIIDTLGLKIAYCAFAPHAGTVNLMDYEGAARLVAGLKEQCDVVIVGFHGGAEGKDHQHVTREDEEFLGNNRGNVYRFAHTVIDAGADLVIGSGPHVARAVEFYKGRLIAYSLGNFCTYSRFNLSGPNALAPALEVWMDGTGRFIKGRIFSFLQPGEGGPVPDPENLALKKIRELTSLDFPEKKVQIDDEGWITPDDNEKSSPGVVGDLKPSAH